MNKRLLALIMLLVLFVSVNMQSVNYGQSNQPKEYLTDGKAYMVTVKLYNDKIVVIDKVNKIDSVLGWYLDNEDIKTYNQKGNTWYYDYKNDILYRVCNGMLYNMNDL